MIDQYWLQQFVLYAIMKQNIVRYIGQFEGIMKVCTFFGHRDASKEIETKLKSVLLDLIKNKNVTMFYVGNHGNFDYIVRGILKELKNEYHINYYVVLAYIPSKKYDYEDYSDTIYPDELSATPHKYRIIQRNKWMLKKSDYVVTYVSHKMGGAAHFSQLAKSNGKVILNLDNS